MFATQRESQAEAVRAPRRRIAEQRRVWLALLVTLAVGGALWPPSEAAATDCCVCRLNSCGDGLCSEGLGGTDCATFCWVTYGCFAVWQSDDTCDAGCGGFVPSATPTITPTGTPTLTPTLTGTPSQTPTHTPTASPTTTPTSTATETATNTTTPTVTITFTPSNTPTPPTCCDAGGRACANGLPPGVCDSGSGTPVPGAVCVFDVGCRTPTPVPPTRTPTSTFTLTPTNTPTITPTASPPIPNSVDPYKCYRIKQNTGSKAPPKFAAREVKLVDQFGNTTTRVLKPFLLCNPSIERNPSETPGVDGNQINPEAHLVCFKIRDLNDPEDKPTNALVNVDFRNPPGATPTPFISLKVDVLKANIVCMPAAKLLDF